MYVPNVVQTSLLQGDWLAGHVQSGTVTVLSGETELKCMRGARMQSQIAVLKCPKFWRENSGAQNLRAYSFKGCEKFEIQWAYLFSTDCEICKFKNHCTQDLELLIKEYRDIFPEKLPKGVSSALGNCTGISMSWGVSDGVQGR